jgi:hypothetical protein
MRSTLGDLDRRMILDLQSVDLRHDLALIVAGWVAAIGSRLTTDRRPWSTPN